MTPFPELEEKTPSKRPLTIYLGTQHIPEDLNVQQNRCHHLKCRITSAEGHKAIRSTLNSPPSSFQRDFPLTQSSDRTQDLHNMSLR